MCSESSLIPVPKRGSDLTASVKTSFVFARQRVILEVIETYSGVVACHQNLREQSVT